MPRATPDPVLPAARIRYRDDQPYSLDFADIYHAADGAAEVRRVFLAPCDIAGLAAARTTAEPTRRVLRIGELGFGSGLNFIVAAEACLEAGVRLQFVSFEALPIGSADFAAIAAARAAHLPLYRELADAYPPRLRGWHQRHLAGGRVRLVLWLGGADDGLADLGGRQRQPFDAWFLDGFAPDRNPALWTDALYADLAALSGSGTRVATFTAAGRVRRGLESAGFAMRRVDQQPHKRESLAGTFAGRGLERYTPPPRVMVLGRGLAGASAARHLTQAGIEVAVAEPAASGHAAAPPAGSALPAAVLHLRLLADASPTAELRAHGYLYAAALLAGRPGFESTGVLQLAGDTDAAEKLMAVAVHYAGSGDWLAWLPRDAAAERAGWPVEHGGLLLPGAGVVDAPALVDHLLDGLRVELPPDGAVDLPTVYACGPATAQFEDAAYLEIAPVHGQIDLVIAAAQPRLPLVGNGYLVPAGAWSRRRGFDACLVAGSTYEYRPWADQQATAANLAQLGARPYVWRSRCRGTRCVSSDRTAIAGPLFDAAGRPLPGRFVTTGHGSAGTVTTQLAAAVLAAHLCGDCPPLSRAAEAALSPARFRERQARRGPRHGAR